MKRTLLTVVAALGLVIAPNASKAQVEQGSIMIDPYVGLPTANIFWGAISSELDYKTVGPPISFGGRFEYMVADNFGLGIDANYVLTGYEYTLEDYNYDSNTGLYSDATYGYTAKKLRAMIRFNYHFVQTDNFDMYLGVGAGYKSAKRAITYDGDEDLNATIPSLIPVAFRVALGGRYYFIPNLGVNFELGAGGGGIFQLGLAVKF